MHGFHSTLEVRIVENEFVTPLVRLSFALLAGALIGLERTYQGRPAGFRTHILVCAASSLLMLFTVFQFQMLPQFPVEAVRVDPTRMAQGIMTGIGFLGAGVIVRERLTIRGLTTAASIWMTASIGILIGIGFYSAAGIAEGLTLGTLAVFRLVEARMPTLHYARLNIRFQVEGHMPEPELREMVNSHHITYANLSYGVDGEEKVFHYEMTVRTRDLDNFESLAEALRVMERVQGFSIVPSGD